MYQVWKGHCRLCAVTAISLSNQVTNAILNRPAEVWLTFMQSEKSDSRKPILEFTLHTVSHFLTTPTSTSEHQSQTTNDNKQLRHNDKTIEK